MSFFLDNIEAMQPYVPGESPANIADIIKLNQNENPYPPSPRVGEVLKSFDPGALRVYPDPLADVFRRAAAEVHAIDYKSICVGDGSDDIIIILARAAAGGVRSVAFSTPNFPYYKTQAAVQAANVICPPADTESFDHPLDALAKANAALTFVANPNSPTGAAVDIDALENLARRLDGILVIDEAYGEFAGATAIPLTEKCDNVIVMRTLSKSHSLAGLRLGYAICGEKIMAGVMKTRAIYNVGTLPAAIAAAAISDTEYTTRCCGLIVAQRQRLAGELTQRNWRVWPSGGNFLMCSPPAAAAKEYFDALKARNVLIRYFKEPPMDDKLRISIGTPLEIDKLLAAIDDYSGARAFND